MKLLQNISKFNHHIWKIYKRLNALQIPVQHVFLQWNTVHFCAKKKKKNIKMWIPKQSQVQRAKLEEMSFSRPLKTFEKEILLGISPLKSWFLIFHQAPQEGFYSQHHFLKAWRGWVYKWKISGENIQRTRREAQANMNTRTWETPSSSTSKGWKDSTENKTKQHQMTIEQETPSLVEFSLGKTSPPCPPRTPDSSIL